VILSLPAAIGAAALALAGGAAAPDGADLRPRPVSDEMVETPSDTPFRLSPRQHCTAVNPATTASIVEALNESRLFCAGLIERKRAYVVDCVAERLRDVTRRMSGTRGYENVQSALLTASSSIGRMVLRNQSDALETTRFRGRGEDGHMIGTQRRLVPLAEARREAVALNAASVIEQADSWLTQVPVCSRDVAEQLQAIAAAIGEHAVILRAAAR